MTNQKEKNVLEFKDKDVLKNYRVADEDDEWLHEQWKNKLSGLFDIRVDGESIPYDMVPEDFKSLWVPIVFDGTLTLDKKEVVIYSDVEKGIHKTKLDYLLPKSIVDLCKGNELVSGNEVHIREGVVLRPYVDRMARDGTKLRLKIINPAYKETGEEIN